MVSLAGVSLPAPPGSSPLCPLLHPQWCSNELRKMDLGTGRILVRFLRDAIHDFWLPIILWGSYSRGRPTSWQGLAPGRCTLCGLSGARHLMIGFAFCPPCLPQPQRSGWWEGSVGDLGMRAESLSLQTKLCPSSGCCNHHIGSAFWGYCQASGSSCPFWILLSCQLLRDQRGNSEVQGSQLPWGSLWSGVIATKKQINCNIPPKQETHPPSLPLPFSSLIPSVGPFLSPSFPDACNTFRKNEDSLGWKTILCLHYCSSQVFRPFWHVDDNRLSHW